jgi:hypothetical protein
VSAAFNVAEPERSAGLDDCDETDDDAADKDSSILFACAGAAAIRAGEIGGLPRSELKKLHREKSVDSWGIFCPKYNESACKDLVRKMVSKCKLLIRSIRR